MEYAIVECALLLIQIPFLRGIELLEHIVDEETGAPPKAVGSQELMGLPPSRTRTVIGFSALFFKPRTTACARFMVANGFSTVPGLRSFPKGAT